MPGGDRTGPRRLGSMTGRGLGYCAGYDTPGFAKGSGMGRGRGWGQGRGRGYGRGMDWGYGPPIYKPTYAPYASRTVQPMNSEYQLTRLKQEKEYLELEMKGMKNTIEEISKKIADLAKEE